MKLLQVPLYISIRLGKLILCENGTFTAEHCAARNIKLNDSSVLTATGNPYDNGNYLGAAIRNVNTFHINDNARAVVSNYRGSTFDFYDHNPEIIVSDNGVLEIKGNANSKAIPSEKVEIKENDLCRVSFAGEYVYFYVK